MASNQKVYENMTRTKLENLKSQLRSEGFAPPNGDHAMIRGSGVEIDADYSERDATLTLTIRKTPPFISYSYVFHKIDDFIAKSGE